MGNGNMKKMVCPKCGGRVFDISKIPKERIMRRRLRNCPGVPTKSAHSVVRVHRSVRHTRDLPMQLQKPSRVTN